GGLSCGGLARRLLRLLLSLGRGLSDALINLVRELGEVLDKEVDELRGHAVILCRVRPGAPRVEDRRVDARNGHRHLEPEVRVLAELDIVEAAIERGIEERTRLLDGHALADAILAAGPAGVEQPALD